MYKRKGFTPLEIKISNRENWASKRFLTGPFKKDFTNGAGFTLIELLVVIAIIALLMAILMPALNKANKQAKMVVCQSNLRHWGPVWSMYTDDNNGEFCGFLTGGPEHWWPLALLPYYREPDLCLCPSATKLWSDGGWGTFAAWGIFTPDPETGELVGEWIDGYEGLYGSYGANEWIGNVSMEISEDWDWGADVFWRRVDVRGAAKIPVLLDCMFMGSFPEDTDYPPEYDGAQFILWDFDSMGRYCINRHNGYVNSLFMDWSVSKVGLKELWTLKWHREFNVNGDWTIAGFGGNESACASAWDEAAPWMKSFPEY